MACARAWTRTTSALRFLRSLSFPFAMLSTISITLFHAGSFVTSPARRCAAAPSRFAAWQALRVSRRRHFAVSPRAAIAVNEMSPEDFASLRVDQDRMMNDIHSTCEWGKGERWGE